MKFTRDSMLYTVSFFGSVLTFVVTEFSMLHAAFPSLSTTAEARIKFAAALIGFVTGWLKMSPAPLSQDSPLATKDSNVALSPVNSSKPLT